MKNVLTFSNAKPIIEIVDLVKQFDDKVVLDNFNLKIDHGQFVTLLGPSGSGKTTALRLIAGFDWPTRGEIRYNGRDMKDLPAYKRPTQTIFQDYALFPHLNVENNIKYGLRIYRIPKENIDQQAHQKLDHFQKKWKTVAKEKLAKLDREQTEYETIMETTKQRSHKYKKAQKWLDDSDFNYSYWENYVQLKTQQYSKRFLTRKMTKDEIDIEVKKVMELIGLLGNEKKSIDQLSGGMKQRVSLARSLVMKPEVLLLDEPLSALDMRVRQKMQQELKDIQRKLGMTFILVTHDQVEALTLSDKVAVIRDGKVAQFGSPQDIYDEPINAWIASFVGRSNIFKGHIIQKGYISIFGGKYKALTANFKDKQKVDVMLRPEDILIGTRRKGKVQGVIKRVTYQGTMWEYLIDIVDKNKKLFAQNRHKIKLGSIVGIDWDWQELHIMESDDK